MDRIVIAIRPTPSDEGLLRVEDPMQQVVDAVGVLKEAEKSLVARHEAFEWRLERASTNSPFTVVAVADARNPSADVTEPARRVRSAVSSGMRTLLRREPPPPWMTQGALGIARNVLTRTQNGVARTEIDFSPDTEDRDALIIDRETADVAINAIAALNLLFDESDLPAREAFGEIEGAMVAAGCYRNRPTWPNRSI
jgi:hypothetical protein